jgi:hypothetical protein
MRELWAASHNWNTGILEYWNDGYGGIKSKKRIFPLQLPLFHYSIIPRGQQKSDVDKRFITAMHWIRD